MEPGNYFERGDETMNVVFMLEEPSMKAFLDTLLPKIDPGLDFLTIKHNGKNALKKSLPRKLAGWIDPDVKFIVVMDQDDADCKKVKSELEEICAPYRHEVLIRIACHELESWYFGDLNAVEKAFNINNISTISRKRKYRNPDEIVNAKEEFRRIVPSYQQVSGAETIANYMDCEKNSSVSFRVFVEGVQRFAR